jgi:hypothetical protein
MENSTIPVGRTVSSVKQRQFGTKPNRTVRAVIARLVWAPGSKGSITPVNVSQAVSPSAIREWIGFTPRRVPGAWPGGGLT